MNQKIEVKIKNWDNHLYPIVMRKKGTTRIDECPFCGESHMHSSGEGHRIPHCDERKEYFKEIQIDGTVFPQSRGYFIEEY